MAKVENVDNEDILSFLDQKLGCFIFSVTAGASAQLFAESLKIIRNSDQAKFPNGWSSLNPVEEVMEGGIAATAGSLVAVGLYRLACRLRGSPLNRRRESGLILIGGHLGYSLMVWSGVVLHDIWNVSDIKWGPFK